MGPGEKPVSSGEQEKNGFPERAPKYGRESRDS
jgi:hypothetical protein